MKRPRLNLLLLLGFLVANGIIAYLVNYTRIYDWIDPTSEIGQWIAAICLFILLAISSYLHGASGGLFGTFLPYMAAGFVIVAIALMLLGCVAFSTVFERKSIAVMQNRRGPNVAGVFGLLQAIADGVKLVTKAQVSKKQNSLYLYYFAPFCSLFLSWYLAIFSTYHMFDSFSLFWTMIFLSLNVYSVPIAGMVTSHSKYAFLGGIRSLAQLLSYELCLSVLFLIIAMYSEATSLGELILYQELVGPLAFPLFPVLLLWVITFLAETNRVPFDLPEAEAELVAGFATEYSSFAFAAFFLAEYGTMLVFSYLTAVIFFGCWNLYVTTVCVFFIFVWARTTLPRFKVDQLLWLGWFTLLPMALLLYLFYFLNINFLCILYDWLWDCSNALFLIPFSTNSFNIERKMRLFRMRLKRLFLNSSFINSTVGAALPHTYAWFKREAFSFDRVKEPTPFKAQGVLFKKDNDTFDIIGILFPVITLVISLCDCVLSLTGEGDFVSFFLHLEILGAFTTSVFGSVIFLISSLVLFMVSQQAPGLREESSFMAISLFFLFSCQDFVVFYIAFESLVAPTFMLIQRNRESMDFTRAARILLVFSYATMFFFFFNNCFYLFISG